MSPAMTPSFTYHQHHTPTSLPTSEFSQLASPAMLPQKHAQLIEQYEQLEHAKMLINQKLSEFPQNIRHGHTNLFKNTGI